MKHFIRKTIYFAIALVALAACASKEKKAEALIKDYMFKSLYDFDSYQVVETKIDSAFFSPYTDAEIMEAAGIAAEALKEYNSHYEKAQRAVRSMNIWSDSYSSYGSSQYKEYKNEAAEELKEMKVYFLVYLDHLKKIKELNANLPDGFKGWEVNHSFRCKTKGGQSALGHYLFITDKKVKSILYNEDSEDEDILAKKKAVKDALSISDEELEKNIAEWKNQQ